MTRLGRELLLATRSAGKIREIRQISAEMHLVWHSLDEFPAVPEAPETGATFADNALQKALFYAARTGLPTLADDSGLEVDALGGRPGVHSAYFAGTPRNDNSNNRALIAALAGVPCERRTARYRCVMVLVAGAEVLLQTSGTLDGQIIDEARGEGGFGYDPHFLLPALGRTAAELLPEEKNAISHRGQALREALRRLEALRR